VVTPLPVTTVVGSAAPAPPGGPTAAAPVRATRPGTVLHISVARADAARSSRPRLALSAAAQPTFAPQVMLLSRDRTAAPHHAKSTQSSAPDLPSAQAPSLGLPSPWSAAPATTTAATAHTPAVDRDRPVRADARAAHGSSSTLPAPATPFGPPGRGVVGSASGMSGASATAGVTCALLFSFFLLLATPPLRRHRMLSVMALPAGFTALQQRPG
jgi:hypothetical protein